MRFVVVETTLGNGIDPIILPFSQPTDCTIVGISGASACTISSDPNLNSDELNNGLTDQVLEGVLMYPANSQLHQGMVFPIQGGKKYFIGFGKNQTPGYVQLWISDVAE